MDTTKLVGVLTHLGAGAQIGATALYIAQNYAKADSVAIVLLSLLSTTLAGYAGYKSYQGQGTTPSKPGTV